MAISYGEIEILLFHRGVNWDSSLFAEAEQATLRFCASGKTRSDGAFLHLQLMLSILGLD